MACRKLPSHLTIQTDTASKTESSPSQIKKLSGAEIRERFLSFYESKGHARLPSSSLVPEDPTVLLTIAGMLQFKPIFLGQAPRKVPRATTTQKCVRTNDIEASHLPYYPLNLSHPLPYMISLYLL